MAARAFAWEVAILRTFQVAESPNNSKGSQGSKRAVRNSRISRDLVKSVFQQDGFLLYLRTFDRFLNARVFWTRPNQRVHRSRRSCRF